jgi:hypothetical protein
VLLANLASFVSNQDPVKIDNPGGQHGDVQTATLNLGSADCVSHWAAADVSGADESDGGQMILGWLIAEDDEKGQSGHAGKSVRVHDDQSMPGLVSLCKTSGPSVLVGGVQHHFFHFKRSRAIGGPMGE